MTQLAGTEKQIQWAEDIRAKMLAPERISEVEAIIRSAETRQPAQAAAVRKALEIVTAETSAAWWIDQRGLTLKLVVGTLGKSLVK